MPESINSPLRFLVADDHALIRTGLTAVLKESYPGSIVDLSVDGTDMTERLATTTYDLIITDIQMGSLQTVALIKYLHINYPATPVLVYSMVAENKYGLSILQAGAAGFVSKQSQVSDLLTAIAEVLSGKKFYAPIITELLCEQLIQKDTNPFSTLSPRQLQIILLLLAGITVTAISKMLSLEQSTTATHKANAFRKLKVSNILELKSLSERYPF